MTITPDDKHRMPKPVADMFRVLELGAVDEHREGKMLDRVEARLRAERHLVDTPQLTTADDVDEPTAAADVKPARKQVKVTGEAKGRARSTAALVGALIESGSAAGVWRLITRALAALLLLALPVLVLSVVVASEDGFSLVMVQVAAALVVTRDYWKRLLRYALGNTQDHSSSQELTASAAKRRPTRARRVNVRASRIKGRDNRG